MSDVRTNEDPQYTGLGQAQKLLQYDADHNMANLGDLARAQRAEEMAAISAEIERIGEGKKPSLDPALSPYEQLEHIFRRYIFLHSAGYVHEWMSQTQPFMQPQPDAAIVNDEAFKVASEALAQSETQLISQPDMERLFAEARAQTNLDPVQKRNLELMHRTWVTKGSIPEADAKAWAGTVADASSAWKKLKTKWKAQQAEIRQQPDQEEALKAKFAEENKGDFETYRPFLTRLFEMAAKRGEVFKEKLGLGTAYEGLLTDVPGYLISNVDFPQQTIDELYGRMRTELPGLVDEVTALQNTKPPIQLPLVDEVVDGKPVKVRAIPVAVQQRVIRRLGEAMGYDFTRGRMDESTHPFTADNGHNDARVTTAHKDDDCFASIFSSFHEFGHALYEQAMPQELHGKMVGLAQSLWLHESQSMFWDHHVAMTPEFFQYLRPILIDEMKKEPGCKFIDFSKEAWSWENLYRLNTKVERSLIRTEADPVTYPLHLMVRDVERNIVNSYKDGTLAEKVANLPAEWNRRSKELLGVEAPDLAHSFLQDMHWSNGFIGYFPAYNGTIASAQMKDAMINRDHLDFGELVRTGQFKVFANWLKENVQKKASLYSGDEIMTQATGAPLSAKSFDYWKDSMRSMLVAPYISKVESLPPREDKGHGGV